MTPTVTTVEFANPVEQAGTKITKVKMQKPKAGALRGLSLGAVFQMDVAAMITLLPRVTEPALAPATIEELELEDFRALALEVLGFFSKTPATMTPDQTPG